MFIIFFPRNYIIDDGIIWRSFVTYLVRKKIATCPVYCAYRWGTQQQRISYISHLQLIGSCFGDFKRPTPAITSPAMMELKTIFVLVFLASLASGNEVRNIVNAHNKFSQDSISTESLSHVSIFDVRK